MHEFSFLQIVTSRIIRRAIGNAGHQTELQLRRKAAVHMMLMMPHPLFVFGVDALPLWRRELLMTKHRYHRVVIFFFF